MFLIFRVFLEYLKKKYGLQHSYLDLLALKHDI